MAPDREPDDIPRRRFELGAAGTIGMLGCAGSAPTSASTPDPCATLSAAVGVAIHAFYRPLPHFALGGSFVHTRFSWDPGHAFDPGARGDGRWTYVALAARGYLFDTGTIEPYVGSSIGSGFLSMRSVGSGVDDQLWRNSIAMAGSLGVDLWVSGRLRAGAFGELFWQPGGGTQRCQAGTCLSVGSAIARIPDHDLRAGATLTLGLGDEL